MTIRIRECGPADAQALALVGQATFLQSYADDLPGADILAHCREHLAGFKTPKRIFFVDALPKNPSGKLLKRQLREEFTLV